MIGAGCHADTVVICVGCGCWCRRCGSIHSPSLCMHTVAMVASGNLIHAYMSECECARACCKPQCDDQYKLCISLRHVKLHHESTTANYCTQHRMLWNHVRCHTSTPSLHRQGLSPLASRMHATADTANTALPLRTLQVSAPVAVFGWLLMATASFVLALLACMLLHGTAVHMFEAPSTLCAWSVPSRQAPATKSMRK